MSYPFYVYGSLNHFSHSLPEDSFDFLVPTYQKLDIPSFLLWFFADDNETACLCKVKRFTRPADMGMKVCVYDVRTVHILGYAILHSAFPELVAVDLKGKDQLDWLLTDAKFQRIPNEKTELVKNALLRSNPGIIDDCTF